MDMGALRRIVAANIVSLRTANHMTQLELGEKLNYSDKAISRWERGEAVPDAGVLLQLSQLFGVTVDYLLHEHAEEKSQKIPPRRINHRTVALISFIGVWTAALFVFIVFYLLGQIQWLSFVYALPVSLTVLLVMNSVYHLRPELEPAGHGLSVRVAAELVDSLSAGHPRPDYHLSQLPHSSQAPAEEGVNTPE